MTTAQRHIEEIAARGKAQVDRAPEYQRTPRKRRYWNPELCGRTSHGGTSYYPEYAPPPAVQRVMLRVGRTIFY